MFKKVLFTLGLLSLFLLISCNNLIENDYGSNQLAFSIGDAAGTIESAVKANESINDNTELNIQCELLRGETVVDTQSVTTALMDLDSASFSLKNIPNGNSYYISIKIFYNDTVIYDALSDVIIISEKQEDVGVSLQLKQKNSSITFDPCGGSFKEGEKYPTSYFINSSIVLPVPEKPHYQFDGWYLSKDFAPEKKVESLGKTCFLGDVKLYAKWIGLDKVAGVNITPDVKNIDYGDSIKLEIAAEGATIHYTTDGSKPTENSPVYNGNIEVTDDIIKKNDKITVKAIAVKKGMENSDVVTKEYKLKRYTVSFDDGGHGTAPDNITGKRKGESVGKPEDLTADGWSFDGWYKEKECITAWDFAKDTVTADITLYAKWTEWNTVSAVTFSKNGEVDYNDEITLSCVTEGATIHYTVGGGAEQTAVNSATINITDNVTIKAYATKTGMNRSTETSADYTIITYSVTFHTDHGKVPDVLNLRKGDSITSPGDLTAEGYTFCGWYGTSDCQGTVFNFDTTKIQTNGVDIYAKWTPITYSVKFDANGGTGDVPVNITDQKYDTEFTLPSYTLTKSGFNSKGKWNTEADGSGTSYNADASTLVKNLTSADNTTVTLYAQWTDVAPGDIQKLDIKTGDTKVTLIWTAPAVDVADYKGVIITYNTNQELEVPKGTLTAEITGLANGTKYDFKVQTVDNAGHRSTGVTASQYAMIGLTESPKVLTNYKSPNTTPAPSAGGTWTYVEFGDWPQTKIASDVTTSTETVEVNGWICYYGSDGYYYVKEKAKPHSSVTEYTLDTDYYFKLEPIKWRVLTDDYKVPAKQGNYISSNKKLLFAEKALAAHMYHATSNKYDTSEVRDYLNGTGNFNNAGFLQKAFTSTAIEKIAVTNVDNSEQSTFGREEQANTHSFWCGNTTDKIFLLSVKEVTTAEYGFGAYDAQDTARQRKPTDYAKATGISVGSSSSTSWLWLRSPNFDSSRYERIVDRSGNTYSRNSVDGTEGGVVPALSISFQ